MAAPMMTAVLLIFLLASSCCASPPHAAAGGGGTPEEKAEAAAAATTMGRIADPKCTDMVRCNPGQCTDYCYLIGLVHSKGFCTFRGMQFYCCCPVPFRRAGAVAAAKTPAISS